MKILPVLIATALFATAATASPPPRGGTVALQPSTGDGEYDPSMAAFVDAAGAALTARGFTLLDDPAHAAYVADLVLSRSDVGTGLTRDPHPDHVMVGPGVIVPLPTGDSHLSALRRTRLELRIRRRAAEMVWDGTAMTVRQADTRTGTDQVVASDLVAALLHDYPIVPKAVIPVP